MTRLTSNMVRGFGRTVAIALAVGVCTLTMVRPPPARAQDAGVNKTVSINLQGQPVQTALKLLFNSTGRNYTIDPAVQGTVTINLQDVTFDVALRSLLRAANPPLSSDIVDNIYQIKVKQYDAVVNPNATGATPTPQNVTLPEGIHAYRIPIDHYDASIIAGLLAQAGAKGSVVVVPPNYIGSSGGQGQGQGQGGMGGGFGGGMGGMGGGMMGGMGGGGFGGGGMGGGGMMGGGGFGGGGMGGGGGYGGGRGGFGIGL